MPIQTAGTFTEDYTQDDIEASPASVRSATVQQAITDLLGPAIYRAGALSNARKYGELRGFPRYDAAGASGYMAERGLDKEFTFDRDYNGDELRILAERKRAELKRSAILARANNSVTAQAGRFGLQIATSLLDPLTVATGFVPVIGPARYAAMIGRAGGAAGRAGVRLGVGAAEGAVGAAIVEPVIFGAKAYEQADYDLSDSLLNIAVGGAFGGGLHVAGGALTDVGRARRETQATERVTRLRELLTQNEAQPRQRAEPGAAADAVPTMMGPDPVQLRALANEVDSFLDGEQARLSAIVEGDDAFLVRIRNDLPELNERATDVTRIRDAAARVLEGDPDAQIRAEAMRLARTDQGNEYAIQRVRESGGGDGSVFPQWQKLAQENVTRQRADSMSQLERANNVLNDLRRDIDRAHRVIAADSDLSYLKGARNSARDLADRIDILPTALREQMTRRLSAVEQVAIADPNVREAGLRSAVAQAVTGEAIEVGPIYSNTPQALQQAAARLADPDQRPLADPDAVRRADAVLADGEAADLAAIEAQALDLDAQIRAVQQEAKLFGDDAAALFDEIAEDAKAAEVAAREGTMQANMLVVCAMRHGV